MSVEENAKRITPENYFEQVLPNILKEKIIGTNKNNHTYGFRLFGEDTNEWTIDMGQHRVHNGLIENPDFYIEMDGTDFSAMMIDELDVDNAIVDGRIRWNGDLNLLGELAEVLTYTN